MGKRWLIANAYLQARHILCVHASRRSGCPLCLRSLLPSQQAAGPAGTADAIHRVLLERWDLDQAEALQGDALTLSAQAGSCLGMQPALCRSLGDVLRHCAAKHCGTWQLDGACSQRPSAADWLPSLHLPRCPQFGAFMQGVELFDAAAYGLSAAEAAAMDPQHRWAGA